MNGRFRIVQTRICAVPLAFEQKCRRNNGVIGAFSIGADIQWSKSKWVISKNRIIPIKAASRAVRSPVKSPASRRKIQGKAVNRVVRNPGKAANRVVNKAAKTANLSVQRSEFPLIFA